MSSDPQDTSIEFIDLSTNAGDSSDTEFSKLPAVVKVKQMLQERGYGEDDPIIATLDIHEALFNSLKKLIVQSEQIHGALLETCSDLGTKIPYLDAKIDNSIETFDETLDTLDRHAKQVERHTTILGKAVVVHQDHSNTVAEASKLFKNTGKLSIFLNYSIAGIAVAGGFISGIIVANSF